jgi:HSP20 family molecular chaperone IbpA
MHSNPTNKPVVQVDPISEVPNSLNPQLFEIHGFVVIRTIIPDDVSEKDIKVLIASSHVTIKGDPSGNEHIIPLPQGSKKEGAVAAFKNRILEIKIPREIETEASDEVDVQYF